MAVKMYFKLKKLMYDFDEICDSSDEDSKPKGRQQTLRSDTHQK